LGQDLRPRPLQLGRRGEVRADAPVVRVHRLATLAVEGLPQRREARAQRRERRPRPLELRRQVGVRRGELEQVVRAPRA
jgi:hypothetical protein